MSRVRLGVAGVSLGSEEEEDAAGGAERSGAEELLSALRRHKVVCNEPPPPPALKQGDAVLAVLEEDGEWHEATVEAIRLPPSGRGALAAGIHSEAPAERSSHAHAGSGPPLVAVRFVEWAKQQETARAKVVALVEVAPDEGATQSEGECELCGRCMKLSFHHLVS